jgi:hypothetical protein
LVANPFVSNGWGYVGCLHKPEEADPVPEVPIEPLPLTPLASAVPASDRRTELLERFGLMSEADLSLLWGVSIKTLRNKPFSDLPKFTTVGRRRLFYVSSVHLLMQNTKPPRRRKLKVRAKA